MSNLTGNDEIYVRPFPDVEKKIWPISLGNGLSPLWSPDGRELFYLSLDNAVMAVDIETKPTFDHGEPKVLFRHDDYDGFTPTWDIHPNGKRFLMVKPLTETGEDSEADNRINKIYVVLNWFEELKQRVPVD